MEISIETLDGVTVIRLNGSLDARSVNGFRDQISALISAGATQFVVDAAQLRYVDSSGLGALLYLRRFARQGKGDVRIASAGRELLVTPRPQRSLHDLRGVPGCPCGPGAFCRGGPAGQLDPIS